MKKLWMILSSLFLLAGAKAQTKDSVVKKETSQPAPKKTSPAEPAKAKAAARQHDDESPKETRKKNTTGGK